MAQKKKTSSFRKSPYTKAGNKRRKPMHDIVETDNWRSRLGKGSNKRDSYPGSPLAWLA
jgi:hypothetical protein